ncbi:DarT ssDNA thymidine ADP-ribosyltransferase family protein [Caulobacter sp. DWP3-1-3b2]|uniref:DarT ssDNA thymidine ADP-ribosyltransferase family protein n=1 Tax=Caulobacter sp. DWP3-1-3b2 TaxID=2804643 RepID=UPI003CF3851E
MLSYQDEIRRIVVGRHIPSLLHFTQTANLKGILRHGLLPRTKLAVLEYTAYASAQHRLDDSDEAISVSISEFNSVMFASKRIKSGHNDWVVLGLSPEILWTHICRFCWSSAAKKEIKNHRGWRGGPWAFEEMFAGSDEARGGLERCYPTDPEAEVQVLEPIAADHILGAVVGRLGMVEPVKELLRGLPGGSRPVLLDEW